LGRDNCKYVEVHPIEVVQTTPAATACQSFEEFGKRIVFNLLRAIEGHTHDAQSMCDVLHCLSFAYSRGPLYHAT